MLLVVYFIYYCRVALKFGVSLFLLWTSVGPVKIQPPLILFGFTGNSQSFAIKVRSLLYYSKECTNYRGKYIDYLLNNKRKIPKLQILAPGAKLLS